MLKMMTVLLLFIAVLCVVSRAGAVNITMHGKLVAEPCSIVPGDEKKEVFVGHIGPAFLYENVRTAGTDFALRLENCNISAFDSVSVTFSGSEDSELPGHLALDTSCTARGVAIGLETLAGKPLPLFSDSDIYPLTHGTSAINLRAFVRASSRAIANREIKAGSINATATFILNYS